MDGIFSDKDIAGIMASRKKPNAQLDAAIAAGDGAEMIRLAGLLNNLHTTRQGLQVWTGSAQDSI